MQFRGALDTSGEIRCLAKSLPKSDLAGSRLALVQCLGALREIIPAADFPDDEITDFAVHFLQKGIKRDLGHRRLDQSERSKDGIDAILSRKGDRKASTYTRDIPTL